jgi:hypothetical protein
MFVWVCIGLACAHRRVLHNMASYSEARLALGRSRMDGYKIAPHMIAYLQLRFLTLEPRIACSDT